MQPHEQVTGAQNIVSRTTRAGDPSQRKTVALLALIVTVAVAVRVWHIGWGLPDIFEEATPFMQAWRFWQWDARGLDFDPRFFNYPALTFYLQWLVQAVHYALGHLTGSYADLDAFRNAFTQDPTASLLLARGFNIAIDVGTVVAVAAVAMRLIGQTGALIVAGLSAINPLQVLLAQQVNVDVPMTFFLVIALYCMVRLSDDPKFRWYWMSGLFIGLAASCKYTAALLLISLLFAGMLSGDGKQRPLPRRMVLMLVGGMGASLLTFLVINPYVILNFPAFRSGFAFEAHHMSAGHFGIREDSSTLGYYVLESIPFAFGWIVVAAATVGTIVVLLRHLPVRRWVPVLCYLGVTFTLLASWKMRADRYLLPAVPGVLLLAGMGVLATRRSLGNIVNRGLKGRGRTPLKVIVALGLIIALFWLPTHSLVGYQTQLEREDTRTRAREYITSTIKPASVIAMAPIGMSLPPEYDVLPIPYVALGLQSIAAFYDARWYVDCDLVVGSDFDRARYLVDPDLYAPFMEYFYDSLDSRWRLIQSIEPGLGLNGPAIWLYTPGDAASPDRFPQELMIRLGSVRNPRLLIGFGLNLSSVLDRKGKHGKAEQLWKDVTLFIMTRFDAREVLTIITELRPEVRQTSRIRDLERQIRSVAI